MKLHILPASEGNNIYRSEALIHKELQSKFVTLTTKVCHSEQRHSVVSEINRNRAKCKVKVIAGGKSALDC